MLGATVLVDPRTGSVTPGFSPQSPPHRSSDEGSLEARKNDNVEPLRAMMRECVASTPQWAARQQAIAAVNVAASASAGRAQRTGGGSGCPVAGCGAAVHPSARLLDFLPSPSVRANTLEGAAPQAAPLGSHGYFPEPLSIALTRLTNASVSAGRPSVAMLSGIAPT